MVLSLVLVRIIGNVRSVRAQPRQRTPKWHYLQLITLQQPQYFILRQRLVLNNIVGKPPRSVLTPFRLVVVLWRRSCSS